MAGGRPRDNAGEAAEGMMKLEYLTSREVATLARLSTRRLAELRLAGVGPRVVRTSPGPTGKALYRAADVHSWLQRNAEQFEARLAARRTGS